MPAPRSNAPAATTVETYEATTADGWRLGLTRHRRGEGGRPLLLVHGFTQNRRTFTAGGFVEPLLARGFDVHLGELRGHGRSSRERQRRLAASSGRALPRDLDFGWDVADYASRDVPALIDAVKARTGAERILYGGHSLGGIIGYRLAVTRDDIAALVTLASPVVIGAEAAWVRAFCRIEPLARRILRLRRRSAVIPWDLLLGSLYGGTARAHPLVARAVPADLRLYAPEAAADPAIIQILRTGLEREPARVLGAFMRWAKSGAIRLPRGEPALPELLQRRLHVPLLACYGEADVLCGRASLAPLLAMDAERRRVVGFEGAAHLDLTVGNVRAEVATLVSDFLAATPA